MISWPWRAASREMAEGKEDCVGLWGIASFNVQHKFEIAILYL